MTCESCGKKKVEFSEIVAFDKTGTQDMISMSWLVESYLATHLTENYKTVELALRANECATRLIAAIPNPKMPIPLVFRGKPQKYELHYVMGRDATETEKFFKVHGMDQKANLERLEETGQCLFEDLEEMVKTFAVAGVQLQLDVASLAAAASQNS